jgi:hypothetical protein
VPAQTRHDRASGLAAPAVPKGPSIGFLGLVNNHGIHHRRQLMTYLRPMGSKVPPIYGGSADEPFQGA